VQHFVKLVLKVVFGNGNVVTFSFYSASAQLAMQSAVLAMIDFV